MHAQYRSRQSGLTLIESAAVLGVIAVLFGSGLPALQQLKATQQLNSVAAELRTDLQYARSTAVTLGQAVRLHVQSGAAGSCYVIHTGGPAACSCSADGGASCSDAGRSIRSMQFGQGHPITISANSASMAFDGRLGTVTPTGTLTVGNNKGGQLKVVVNLMGRARTCQSAGSPTGHVAC